MLLNRTVAVYRPGQQVRLKQKMTVFLPEKGGQVDNCAHIGWGGTVVDRVLSSTQFLLPALKAVITLTR